MIRKRIRSAYSRQKSCLKNNGKYTKKSFALILGAYQFLFLSWKNIDSNLRIIEL